MHKVFLLFLLVIVVSACQSSREKRIFITGQVEGASGMVYLQEQKTSELVKIDSLVADASGAFSWDIPSTQESIYSVRISPEEQIVFIAGPDDSILVTGSLLQYPSRFVVSGNVESELLQSFYDYSAGNIREVDSLQALIDMHQGEDDFYELTVRVDSLFNQIWERQRIYEKEFIRLHAGDFSTLLVVNYHFGVRPVLSVKTDMEDYRRVDSGLLATYPENRHTLFFHQWLKEIK